MSMLTAQTLLAQKPESRDGGVVLSYDERLLRRKRLVSEEGISFLVDLASVTNLDDFWGFQLSDGRAIEVVAAVEELVEVRGPELLRYAWHIGNRHTPCQIAPDRLLIRVDHVLEAMLKGLGATLARVAEPFRPEGGAYGHGRTMGHSHGPEAGHTHGPGGHHHQAEPLPPPVTPVAPAGQAAPHQHGASCGCGHSHDAPLPAYQSWTPEAEDLPQGRDFGWHHHGDGKMHYHAPRQPLPDDPISLALGLGAKRK